MNREDVIRNNWVDRYLLGQLTESEQERFEQFYFTCPETQSELDTTQKLIDGFAGNALAALAHRHQLRIDVDEPRARTGRRYNWPAIAASLVAAVSLGVAVNGYRTAGEYASPVTAAADLNVPIISLGATRSVAAAQLIELPDTARRIVFSLDVGGAADTTFAVELVDGNGDIVWQTSSLIADAYGSLTFALPPGILSSGNYQFVATRPGSTEMLRIPVLVESSTR